MSGRLLVTGSNRGTGLAIATLFGERGFRIASLNRTRLGKPWLGEIVCDLSRGAEIGPACDAALAHLGGVDVCILNAAVRQIHRIEDMTDADWDESVATNLSAVFKIMRRMLPALKASRGHLVILGSQAGEHFFEGGAAYCATKAALVALAEVAVLETARGPPGALPSRRRHARGGEDRACQRCAGHLRRRATRRQLLRGACRDPASAGA